MRALAILTPGPSWTDGRPIFDQDPAVLRGHLAAMRRLYDGGTLILGGPFTGGRRGLALMEAPTAAHALAALSRDPAVSSGLFRSELLEVVPYFDAFDGTRTAERAS